ncbi:MAG: hypothetical protein HY094_05630 [Candidatus Melainabacteria bacterium]|nr:hypothetical protein [Candidatus Melainabacteria bacterium]
MLKIKRIFALLLTTSFLTLFIPVSSFALQSSENCTFYKWFNPNTSDKEGKLLLKNCSSCHMSYYKEWKDDKHSMSQNNPFFLETYKQFRQDHPNENGNCALCHNPEAALDHELSVDLRETKNKKTNGVSCDFCHKIESIDQNPLKQGVSGLNIVRPCKGFKDIRFGQIKDPIQPSDKEELKYNSLYKTSLVCAKCHDGSNGNVQVYSTFTEWLNSPAAKRGVQCQSCHMQPRNENKIVDNTNIKYKTRPYYEVHSHSFLTGNPHEFRKKYVNLKIETQRNKNTDKKNVILVKVKVENNNFGHSFPTGSPMRNAVLVLDVKCKNKTGKTTLPLQIKGPRLSSYAGNLSGKPGKLFAKILAETSSEYASQHSQAGILFRKIAGKLGIPAQDWWNVFIASDTRIKANEEDISTYGFETDNNCRITAKLIWRNTWPGLAKLKGFMIQEDLLVKKIIELK